MTLPAVNFSTSSGTPMDYQGFIDTCGELTPRGTINTEEPKEKHLSFGWPHLTNSGLTTRDNPSTASAIMELRKLSGLTWDQLARLFGVSRRSIHFWASGKALNATNEGRLQNILTIVRRISRGNAKATRSVLTSAQPGGTVPFDLLERGQYYEVVNLTETGGYRYTPSSTPLSPESKVERIPTRPEVLADALQEDIHLKSGKARAARSVRIKKKK